MKGKGLMLLVWACLLPLAILAQRYALALRAADPAAAAWLANSPPPASFASSADALHFLSGLVPALQKQGHLTAALDSLSPDSNAYSASLYAGPVFRWAVLSFAQLPVQARQSAGLPIVQMQGRVATPAEVSGWCSRLLDWAGGQGYPFASVGLSIDSISYTHGLYATMQYSPGPRILLDSIALLAPGLQFSRKVLLRHLDIQQGSPYNAARLASVSARLRELPWVQDAAPWTIAYKPGYTTLTIPLKEKKENTLNALVGLLPNNVETGGFLLTVDARLRFHNILAQGEALGFSYQNLQYKSPRLKADLLFPYVLGTALGVDADLDLFKKDTSFRRSAVQVGLRYALSSSAHLRLFYTLRSNRLISVDTGRVRRSRSLPQDADVTARGAGLEAQLFHTDFRPAPRKGWEARCSASALSRSVRQSNAVTALTDPQGFSYGSLYDSFRGSSTQFLISGSASAYRSLGRHFVFRLGYTGGWVGGRSLFRNELFQLGGFALLRGFDEQSIYASSYHIATLEPRIMLSDVSFAYLFTDLALIDSPPLRGSTPGTYTGFGIGTTLTTRSGLLNVSLALGSPPLGTVSFRQARIHFGYQTLF